MFRCFAAAMDVPLLRFSMLWTMIHIAVLPRMDFSQCYDGSVSLVTCHCLRLLAVVLDFPLLRVFAGSYGFLLRCYELFFVSSDGYTTTGFYRCNDRSLLQILFRAFGFFVPRHLPWLRSFLQYGVPLLRMIPFLFGLSAAVRVTADTFMGFLSHWNCD